jgi:hypothetical protein
VLDAPTPSVLALRAAGGGLPLYDSCRLDRLIASAKPPQLLLGPNLDKRRSEVGRDARPMGSRADSIERQYRVAELSELQRTNCRDTCYARMDRAFADEERSPSNRCADEYVKSGGKTGTVCTLNVPAQNSIAADDLNAAIQRCSATCSDELTL